MKRIKNISRYKGYQRQRARTQQAKRLFHRAWQVERRKSVQGPPTRAYVVVHTAQHRRRSKRYHHITAPAMFCFLTNTEQVVRFIHGIERHYANGHPVFVVLTGVRQIDYGAVIALLSIMFKFKTSSIDFNGNFPTDWSARDLLVRSGFFEYLYRPIETAESYLISGGNLSTAIHTHAHKRVEAQLGDRLILAAAKAVWGEQRRCPGVQRALLELMQNTNNHAVIGRTGEKHWWVSVNHVEADSKACFAFVDFGVGIFESLQNKPSGSKWFGWAGKLAKAFSFTDNCELLRLILNGDFHQTVTKEYYRGKGLPGIAEVQRRNQIANLHIITNDVHCSLDKGEFRKMASPFNGTFVYWELNSNNESCSYEDT